jgi:hypothetical protein
MKPRSTFARQRFVSVTSFKPIKITPRASEPRAARTRGGGARWGAKLRALVGSSDRIMLLAAEFVIAGVAMNLAHPTWFAVGGPPTLLRVLSIAALLPGLVTRRSVPGGTTTAAA